MEEGKEMAAHCSGSVTEEKLDIYMSSGRWRMRWGILYLGYLLLKVKTFQISRFLYLLYNLFCVLGSLHGLQLPVSDLQASPRACGA